MPRVKRKGYSDCGLEDADGDGIRIRSKIKIRIRARAKGLGGRGEGNSSDGGAFYSGTRDARP